MNSRLRLFILLVAPFALGDFVSGIEPVEPQRPRLKKGVQRDMAEVRAQSIRALDRPTFIEISETSLAEALVYLGEFHGITIEIDIEALRADKIFLKDLDAPDMRLVQVPLRSVLRLLLAEAKLDCVVDAQGLLVTTREKAAKDPQRVQPDSEFDSIVLEIPDIRGFSVEFPPDPDEAEGESSKERKIRFSDTAFEGLIYGDDSSAKEAQARLDRLLQEKLDVIARLKILNEAQQRKLKLAGQGDVKHWFDRVEQLRAQYRPVTDRETARQLMVDAVPVKFQLEHGPFGETSLFQKVSKSLGVPDPAEPRTPPP
jgi:hypothetical protein